jgi:hypothetical protein
MGAASWCVLWAHHEPPEVLKAEHCGSLRPRRLVKVAKQFGGVGGDDVPHEEVAF